MILVRVLHPIAENLAAAGVLNKARAAGRAKALPAGTNFPHCGLGQRRSLVATAGDAIFKGVAATLTPDCVPPQAGQNFLAAGTNFPHCGLGQRHSLLGTFVGTLVATAGDARLPRRCDVARFAGVASENSIPDC